MVQSRRPGKPGKAAAGESTDGTNDSGMRVLKKYPNRRLYDTADQQLHHPGRSQDRWCWRCEPFVVRDAKTGDDLTRSILLQIILEEETGGVPIFSTQMLSQYHPLLWPCHAGHDGCVSREELQTFTDMQARLAEQAKGAYDPAALTPDLWAQFLSSQAPMCRA